MTLSSVITQLVPHKPLIICDVDEVVLHFVAPFEEYLSKHNAFLRKSSLKLSGNVIDVQTGNAIPSDEAGKLVRSFHQVHVDQQPVISGALEALNSLSSVFQIIFLTNVAEELKDRRKKHLTSLGLPFPVLQNDGSKAETVRILSDHIQSKTIFIDDLPPHHIMVKAAAADVHCIHYLADFDFRNLVEFAPSLGEKAENWPEIQSLCIAKLSE